LVTIMSGAGYFEPTDDTVRRLAELVATRTSPGAYPQASGIECEVVVYEGDTLRDAAADPTDKRRLMAEIASVLRDGPGVVLVREAVERDALDRTTSVFRRLIDEQRAGADPEGDFFAEAGANDRVWNTLEKLAVADPAAFVDYYASEPIAVMCEAWLGPGYQVTSQVNVVNPGGRAQSPHRDYHLGFMSDESAAVFPVHVHSLSPLLTLQVAVAHTDMPVESGPTMVLPHSQKYPPGYVVWKQPAVVELFERHHVQLPLRAGDAVFFCPAVFHAAGSNHTDHVRRMANLLQVSSAFGRTMESIDRARMLRAVFPELRRRHRDGMRATGLDAAIAACAEGYAFPTNLDRDPPVGGLAPPSQADLVRARPHRWMVRRTARRRARGARRAPAHALTARHATPSTVCPVVHPHG
jgi:ectoine hydroxylase-related dioxygenase (phytanoyl-CoA dioxygenase family)